MDDNIEKVQPETSQNFNIINKPITVMGLSPLVFIVVLLLLVSLGVMFYWLLFFSVFLYFPLMKIQKINKEGGPDYLDLKMMNMNQKKYYSDMSDFFLQIKVSKSDE